MRTARYRAVLPKIDRRQSIEREKGKKKKRKKKRGEKNTYARARSSPVRRHRSRAVATRGRFFSHAGRKIKATLPRR
ncbi:hypothetical protein BHE74_00012728, partial [Ensete ventricosum]